MKQEHFEILREEMCSNFQFVLEGHAAFRDELNTKIDAVKDDLTAHRADTEAHPQTVAMTLR